VRIFQVMEARATGSLPLNVAWYRNLYEPLVELGHDVVLVAADEGRVALQTGDSDVRARFSRDVVERFERERARGPFDLVFTYLMDGMIDPEAIGVLRDSDAPVCNFSCNNIHQFDLVERIAPLFTLNLHAERDAGGLFEAIGADHLWWPMASNPKYFAPRNVPETLDATFVGGRYGIRARYILQLLDAGIDVHAYGPRWALETPLQRLRRWSRREIMLTRAALSPSIDQQYRLTSLARDIDEHRLLAQRYPGNLHTPVSDDDLISMYSSSRVSLGFLEVYDAHDSTKALKKHVHLREFEAPMCGAAYLTQYSDELAGYFEPDVEMIMWRDTTEMVEKLRFYLHDDAARAKVRIAGRRRALSCHTYQQRYQSLFTHLGIA
jgi:spore maturation protein CgeB